MALLRIRNETNTGWYEWAPLSAAERAALTGGGDTTLHWHSADRDLANSSGVLAPAHGGTGLGAPGGGNANQLLGVKGDASGLEYKGLSGTTNQVAVTHGAGSITLSLPQDIHTGASPTFGGLVVTGMASVSGLQMGTGAVNGYVLTCDASGYAHWAAPPTVGNHNDLSGLQGGTSGQYYHLTQAQNSGLTGGGNTTLHWHSADRDLSLAEGVLKPAHGGLGAALLINPGQVPYAVDNYAFGLTGPGSPGQVLTRTSTGVDWQTPSGGGGTGYHNDLLGLQGGASGEYYHLTQAEHDGLTGGQVTMLHSHPGGSGSPVGAIMWTCRWPAMGRVSAPLVVPRDCSVSAVYITVAHAAQTAVTCDVLRNGTSIMGSTLPTVPVGQWRSSRVLPAAGALAQDNVLTLVFTSVDTSQPWVTVTLVIT